jgi:hypothetical protein
MLGEPTSRQNNIELAAALVHSNTRVTRAITVLMTNIRTGEPMDAPDLPLIAAQTGKILGSMALTIETETNPPAELSSRLVALDQLESGPTTGRHRLIHLQLGKIFTELSAMTIAMTPPDNAEKTRPEAQLA